MNQKIPKLEGAERQLSEAITLYFERRDPVAIHTLSAAAHQVIYDLALKKGIKASLLKDGLYIRPEKKKEVSRKVAAAENFLKHADKDPDAVLEFNPGTTVYFIVDAIQLHNQVAGKYLPSGQIFLIHFLQKNPDVFEPEVAAAIIKPLAAIRIDPDNFKFYLETLDMLREHKTFEAAMEHLKKGGALPKERT